MRVIFHVDEMEKWGTALTNAENLLDYCEERKKICVMEILANGEAVRLLAAENAEASGFSGRLQALSERTAVFAACNNALKKFRIDREALLPFVTVVPAGVAELVEKQEEGFAYIKP